MPVQVEGHDIYVNTGDQSQTVKICDCRNIRGDYEHYFRIRPAQFGQEELIGELQQRANGDQSLARVIEWLRGIGGVDELAPGRAVVPTAAGDEPPPLEPPIVAGMPQPWFNQAIVAVERGIDALVHEFVQAPYLHRVEHCLHTRLVEILRKLQPLSGRFAFENFGGETQLVHKEWPETTPRKGNDGRRGSFDVVVLSQPQIAGCPSLLTFLEGRLAAPIVIEVGLEYGQRHLQGDRDKLINSQVPAGYLLHLVRGRGPTQCEQDLLNQIEAPPNQTIRTAAVFANEAQPWVKHVGDAALH